MGAGRRVGVRRELRGRGSCPQYLGGRAQRGVLLGRGFHSPLTLGGQPWQHCGATREAGGQRVLSMFWGCPGGVAGELPPVGTVRGQGCGAVGWGGFLKGLNQ